MQWNQLLPAALLSEFYDPGIFTLHSSPVITDLDIFLQAWCYHHFRQITARYFMQFLSARY